MKLKLKYLIPIYGLLFFAYFFKNIDSPTKHERMIAISLFYYHFMMTFMTLLTIIFKLKLI